MNHDDLDGDFKKQFKLVCLKCNSENVVIHFSPGYEYSEMTWSADSLSVGCNDCKQNDLQVL